MQLPRPARHKANDQNNTVRHQLNGYVLLPASPSDEILDVIAEYCFQAPDGKWEVARQDAADAYAALVALGTLQPK